MEVVKKILFVFGTRPEAIKMAPVISKFQENKLFELKVCVTAQHREMLDQVLDIFNIKPDFDLNIMTPRQDLYDVTSRVLIGMRDVFVDYAPDLLLVHGDTTTTFAATLAAFYQKIPVGHVEAGLRTNNIYSPWPEEANRVLTSKLAAYHFAPTETSRLNLVREGVSEDKISITGNTVIDSLFLIIKKIQDSKNLQLKISKKIIDSGYNLSTRKMILITGHRRENFGQGFIDICEAIKELALRFPDYDFVYPVHFNPSVREPVNRILNNTKNIYLIEPLEYEAFVYLMNHCYFIITDSGGIQEEAPSLGKPVLVTRDKTERPEAVEAGAVKLVGTSKKSILDWAVKLIEDPILYGDMSRSNNPYGNGNASEKIFDFLSKTFSHNH